MAGRGEDVSHFFADRGQTMHPMQRANVDLVASMPPELDQRRPAREARKAS
jgi:hypothetical protein